jgi:hypothetical protein
VTNASCTIAIPAHTFNSLACSMWQLTTIHRYMGKEHCVPLITKITIGLPVHTSIWTPLMHYDSDELATYDPAEVAFEVNFS